MLDGIDLILCNPTSCLFFTLYAHQSTTAVNLLKLITATRLLASSHVCSTRIMWSTFRSKTLLSGNTSSSGSSTPKRSQSVDVNANRNVTEEPTSTIEDKASETGNSNESIGNPKKDRSHHAPGGRGGFINPWPSAAPSSTSNTGWLPSFSVPLSWGVKPHPELRREA
jgi:hypothetical protein